MKKNYPKSGSPGPENTACAAQFIEQLTFLTAGQAEKNARFFREPDQSNKFVGVRIADVFRLAKEHIKMPVKEIARLLMSDYYEARLGAVSIMDFQARQKATSPEKRKELYQLYMDNHHRIDNWDLVDRSAPYVVGGYLADKSRSPLYSLARSKNVWERRTAIVSTYYFIRQNDVADTFKIAGLLVNDNHDLINKAVGSWIREAGKRDESRLLAFLEKHGKTMPRTTLRYAIEKLSPAQKKYFLTLS